jgi:hypothetical protein
VLLHAVRGSTICVVARPRTRQMRRPRYVRSIRGIHGYAEPRALDRLEAASLPADVAPCRA